MEEDGSLQGLLLRKAEMSPKSLLCSPELVAITGKAAVPPGNIFKPSMKQHRETAASQILVFFS